MGVKDDDGGRRLTIGFGVGQGYLITSHANPIWTLSDFPRFPALCDACSVFVCLDLSILVQ